MTSARNDYGTRSARVLRYNRAKRKRIKEAFLLANKDNIVLIGMPGVGKSTMGVVLAKVAGFQFIDADLLIQQQCDKTLQLIIDGLGPAGFIEVENRVLSDIDVHNTVISTGGSAVYSEAAMKHLSEIGLVVYLKTSVDELEERIGGLNERGVVSRSGEPVLLRSLYDERCPLYEQYAEVTVDIEGLNIRQATEKALEQISLQTKL